MMQSELDRVSVADVEPTAHGLVWPISEAFVSSLPDVLKPDQDELKDIQEPWQYLLLLQGRLAALEGTYVHPEAQVHPTAVLEGNHWIGPGVVIHSYAVVKGSTYLSAGSSIGDYTTVRDTYAAQGVVLGANSEIIRSFLGPDSSTHRAYLGDSMTGQNVHFGGASGVANQRLDRGIIFSKDQKGVKVPTGLTKFGVIIGDNSSFGSYSMANPGIKVGSNCQIGQRVSLFEDVPDNTRVILRQEQERTQI